MRNATSRDIDEMCAIIGSLECGKDRMQRFATWDERFHLALAKAALNPLMAWLYTEIDAVRARVRWMNIKGSQTLEIADDRL